jgi:hypothetical protein
MILTPSWLDWESAGITAGSVETIGDAVRFTIITDPDGDRLDVGQPPAHAVVS